MKAKEALIRSEAVFDNDENHRYKLKRSWTEGSDDIKKLTAVLFNPAIANELKGDKSSNLCFNTAVDNNCNEFELVNLYSRRSRKGEDLPIQYKVFEQKNFIYIKRAIETSDIVILGWGNDPGPITEHSSFQQLLKENEGKLFCYGINESGEPKHPAIGIAEGAPLRKYDL